MAWANTTLAQAAKSVNQQGPYDSLYRIGSQYEHSLPWSARSYFIPGDGLEKQALSVSSEPSPRLVPEAMVTTYIEMLILSEVIIRSFSLSMLGQLKPLVKLVPSLTALIKHSQAAGPAGSATGG
jgi:hypothetical protein